MREMQLRSNSTRTHRPRGTERTTLACQVIGQNYPGLGCGVNLRCSHGIGWRNPSTVPDRARGRRLQSQSHELAMISPHAVRVTSGPAREASVW